MSDHHEGQPDGTSGTEQTKREAQPHPSTDLESIPAKAAVDSAQQRREFIAVMRSELFAESFSGPLPHPDILAKFEQVLPGTSARIIKMAETQSEHRQALERCVVEGDTRRSWYGLWTGFVIGMTGLIGSIILGVF
jgi:uncharacterized membrane protein